MGEHNAQKMEHKNRPGSDTGYPVFPLYYPLDLSGRKYFFSYRWINLYRYKFSIAYHQQKRKIIDHFNETSSKITITNRKKYAPLLCFFL